MARFDEVIRELRARSGMSGIKLARLANVNSSYIYRMERPGGQVPRRDLVKSLIAALDLDEFDSERLLVAAGYCPEAIARLGTWDATLGVVARVLADSGLTEAERDEFRQIIRAVASRWTTGSAAAAEGRPRSARGAER